MSNTVEWWVKSGLVGVANLRHARQKWRIGEIAMAREKKIKNAIIDCITILFIFNNDIIPIEI